MNEGVGYNGRGKYNMNTEINCLTLGGHRFDRNDVKEVKNYGIGAVALYRKKCYECGTEILGLKDGDMSIVWDDDRTQRGNHLQDIDE